MKGEPESKKTWCLRFTKFSSHLHLSEYDKATWFRVCRSRGPGTVSGGVSLILSVPLNLKSKDKTHQAGITLLTMFNVSGK